MPEFTPLPETDLIDGQITDIGYDPKDWEEHERQSRTYEREAMTDIKLQQPKQDWKGYYEDEFKAQEPQFLEAAWRAVAPNAARVLPNAAKGFAAGIAGAPADLAVISWHTLRWLAGQSGAIDNNDYRFMEDMPEFKNIPGTADYIGEKYFDADVDAMEFSFAQLASPDAIGTVATAAAKTAGVFGGPIAMARQAKAVQTTDPQRAQYLIKNFKDARSMGDAGEHTADIYKQTGWFRVGEDWRFMMDLDNIKFNRTALEQKVAEHVSTVAGQAAQKLPGIPIVGNKVPVRLGDVWDHPSFFESYPELKDFEVNFHVQSASDSTPGVKMEIDGELYTFMGDGILNPQTGAQFTPRASIADSEVDIFGTVRADSWERTEEALAHEIEHFVQTIEGFSRGGSPQEFRRMAQVESIRGNNVRAALVSKMENGDLDPNDMNQIGETLLFEHGGWLNDFPEDQWDSATIEMSRFLKRIDDPLERGLWEVELDSAVSEFTQVVKWYRGVDEVEDIEQLINTMDLGLVDSMANDIYFSLEGEGMSRLAEAVWANRKKLPENFNPGEGFMKQLQMTQQTSLGTMEVVPGGQVRIPNKGFSE